jgi:hypothetical protein
MHGLQKPKLHDNKKQEEKPGPARTEEVLSGVPAPQEP